MKYSKEALSKRLVRYQDLIPCKNAFVDTRTPGSDQKENFTIIGPGVSENPNQHVHIPEAHGFNIGGARQVTGCLNSQHSHITAEVFIAQNSRWRFSFGVNADDGQVELGPGDVISIPTNMFRGFENIGNEKGFLFAVLGGDDPGHVTWAPSVFELAKKYGLILCKGGRLVDTSQGEKVPENAQLETPPNSDEIGRLATPSAEKMSQCVAYFKNFRENPASPIAGPGFSEAGVITPEKSADGFENAGIVPWWEHGFHLRRLRIEPNSSSVMHARLEEEVVYIHKGIMSFRWRNEDNGAEELELELHEGDTLSVPKSFMHAFASKGNATCYAYIVRGSNSPSMPAFLE